jgi:hypothetical protein
MFRRLTSSPPGETPTFSNTIIIGENDMQHLHHLFNCLFTSIFMTLAFLFFALTKTSQAAVENRHTSADFQYQGAFRLPDDFSWGARGMSYYPAGNGGAGSLLITTSEALRTPDGEACHEGLSNCAAYFAEVTIPAPSKSGQWTTLPMAAFIQSPTSFDDGLVQTVHPAHAFVTGIQYVPRQGAQTSDKIYGSLNEWYPEGDFGDNSFPTIWFSNMDGSNAKGVFHVGPQSNALYHGRKMGDFLFS